MKSKRRMAREWKRAQKIHQEIPLAKSVTMETVLDRMESSETPKERKEAELQYRKLAKRERRTQGSRDLSIAIGPVTPMEPIGNTFYDKPYEKPKKMLEDWESLHAYPALTTLPDPNPKTQVPPPARSWWQWWS